jgi:hypothetical protein
MLFTSDGILSDNERPITCISKPLYNLCHSRPLLTNGNIDAVQLLLLIITIIEPFLVDNCINGKSSFTTKQK